MIDISKHIVSKEVFDKAIEEKFAADELHIITTTPDEDKKIIEQLLGIPEGGLSESSLRREKGSENCPNCDRRYNLLDVASTGLGQHEKEFIKEMLTGVHGYIQNNREGQKISCYKCGTRSAYGGCYKTWYYYACY
jgi:hypothetical protein